MEEESKASAGAMHRAILRPVMGLLIVAALLCVWPMRASLVTGNVVDIGLAALETKITFYPTNLVLVSPGGISGGPAKTITATNGAFSTVLDAGDYVVSLPLVPWRKAFTITVPAGATNSYNITNLMTVLIVATNTVVANPGNRLLFNQ